MNDTGTALILEKILNLDKKFQDFCDGNSYEHEQIISGQRADEKRIGRLEMVYAGLIGCGGTLTVLWTIFTFFFKL